MGTLLLAVALAVTSEDPTYTITVQVQNLCMLRGIC